MAYLGRQFHLVDKYLERPEKYGKRDPAMECLVKRIRNAWASGLLEGVDRFGDPSSTRLVEEQARLAYEAYGLVYDDTEQCWKRPEGNAGDRREAGVIWTRDPLSGPPAVSRVQPAAFWLRPTVCSVKLP